MIRFRLFSLFIALTILVNTLFASNQHEHFYSFPTTDAIIESYREVFGPGHDIGEVKFGPLSEKRGSTRAMQAILAIFGDNALEAIATSKGLTLQSPSLEEVMSNMTLGQISDVISKNNGVPTEKILRQFFEFGAQSGNHIPAYKFNEDMREYFYKNLIQTEPKKYSKFVEKVFEKTLASTLPENRTIVAFSVPADLYEKKSLQFIADIFKRHGSRAEFYLSYPRYKIREDQATFERKRANFQESLREGWGHGLDVTGSIEEAGSEKYTDKSEIEKREYIDRIETLASDIARDGGVLKFHAFEAVRTGPFYDAFWKLMEAQAKKPRDKRPSKIIIGHIAQLTDEDIQRFVDLRKSGGLKFVFDANLPSNVGLQGKSFKDLADTLYKLYRNGFEIGFGGDGQGILETYSLSSIVEKVKPHFPPEEFPKFAARVIRDSKRPRAIAGRRRPCRIPHEYLNTPPLNE